MRVAVVAQTERTRSSQIGMKHNQPHQAHHLWPVRRWGTFPILTCSRTGNMTVSNPKAALVSFSMSPGLHQRHRGNDQQAGLTLLTSYWCFNVSPQTHLTTSSSHMTSWQQVEWQRYSPVITTRCIAKSSAPLFWMGLVYPQYWPCSCPEGVPAKRGRPQLPMQNDV